MKIGAVLLVSLCACTALRSPSLPTARVGSAEEAVNAAVRAGARNDPRASRQLQVAEGEIARARERIAQGEYSEAESLLARAELDAEVAAALAREAQLWEGAARGWPPPETTPDDDVPVSMTEPARPAPMENVRRNR